MPDKFETVFHFRPPIEDAAVVGRLVGELPRFDAHGLAPAKYAEAAWRDATDSTLR